jgi:serine/threonine-protein kinase
VIAELDEPALLGVMDVGEASGHHYIAYESVEGETLEAALRRDGRLPLARAIETAASVLDGLAAAARHKLVHGDVKPENVILASGGGVKLAGLGLWRGGEDDAASFSERGRVAHYGAPEQILGSGRDAKSDVWSTGAVLFHAASGRPPIEAGSVGEARAMIEAGEFPRVDDLAELPENVRRSLAKLMAEKPEERYRSAVEAAKALRKLKVE